MTTTDLAAQWLVLAAIVIGLGTFAVWFWVLGQPLLFAVTLSITVFVIACPDALGLATPISIMVGVGKAAEYGILTRNGEALQQAGTGGVRRAWGHPVAHLAAAGAVQAGAGDAAQRLAAGVPFGGEMRYLSELFGCFAASVPFTISGMNRNMLAAFHQLKVLDPVIESVTVSVMDMMVFRNVPMSGFENHSMQIPIANALRRARATAVIAVRPVHMKPNTLEYDAACAHS
mgnify:CR=1 FL=1